MMSRSIVQGTRAGVITAAGVSVGLVLHTLLASAGLGALLATSQWLYTALKFVGALYLVWLGIGLVRSGGQALQAPEKLVMRRPWRLFFDGAFSNLANPKIVIFFLAFLPQFVTPYAGSPALSVAALGVVFATLTFIVKGPLAFVAGRLSPWLRERPRVLASFYRGAGTVLIGLGASLAFERRT